MKALLTIVLVIVTCTGFSQDTVYMRQVDWYGGVCCSSGTNIFLTFTTVQPGWKVDSLVLELGHTAYPLCNQSFWSVTGDNYVVRLGWTDTNVPDGVPENHQMSYSGVNPNDLRKLPGDEFYERLRIYYANGKAATALLQITRDAIAYP